MKFNKAKKITLLAAAICITAAVTSISALATDKFSEPFSMLQTKLVQNKNFANDNIVQVGDLFITKKNLEDFKAYKGLEFNLNNSQISLKDSDLLEELIIEKLILLKAQEYNVVASLDDGKKEAAQAREILSKQPQEDQAMQDRFIATTGLTKDEYWNNYAPKQYQDQRSAVNLLNKLTGDGVLTVGKDLNEFGKKYREYRKALYQSSLESKIKVIDKNITLNK